MDLRYWIWMRSEDIDGRRWKRDIDIYIRYGGFFSEDWIRDLEYEATTLSSCTCAARVFSGFAMISMLMNCMSKDRLFWLIMMACIAIAILIWDIHELRCTCGRTSRTWVQKVTRRLPPRDLFKLKFTVGLLIGWGLGAWGCVVDWKSSHGRGSGLHMGFWLHCSLYLEYLQGNYGVVDSRSC